MYKKLCEDETPMVRRAACTHIGALAAKLQKEHLKNQFLPMFLQLSQDQQDSVRLLSVENCIHFAKLLSPTESVTSVLPTVKKCAQDKSWRVRYMVAEHFKPVSK